MNGINMLSDTQIKKARSDGRRVKLRDGGNLYVVISPTGHKAWRYLWRMQGKEYMYTIGSYPAVTLKMARQERDRIAGLIALGIDPNDERKHRVSQEKQKELENALTFERIAREWYEKKTVNLTPKSRTVKWNRVENHLLPALGHRLLANLKLSDFTPVLQKIASEGHPETAKRSRQIIGQIARYAYIMGYTERNVADCLTEALEIKQETKHRACITEPHAVGALLRAIDSYSGFVSMRYALRILPYVFVRSKELRMARWRDIDLEKRIWTIPAEHMKMKRPHVVPLAAQVVKLFSELKEFTGGRELVFPSSHSKTRCISDMGLLNALRRLGYDKDTACIHGFRSTASTLLNEKGYRGEVIEAQLAHAENDQVRAAYNRAQYMPERIRMMQDYADYLDALREGKSQAMHAIEILPVDHSTLPTKTTDENAPSRRKRPARARVMERPARRVRLA